ncbi:MAG: MSHA pilin protein MshD [Paraglaciecola sp.]|jgi:MSHA pilin protein MshD
MMRQQGLSLIELVIFIVVFSVGVVGILPVFNVTVKASADPLVNKQSTAVAEAMLNEIFAKSFTVGGYAGGDRAQFDDVSDYADYYQMGIKALDGSAIDGLENYEVTVSIDTAAKLGLPAGDIKKITVAVTGGVNTITLIGYRTNYE